MSGDSQKSPILEDRYRLGRPLDDGPESTRFVAKSLRMDRTVTIRVFKTRECSSLIVALQKLVGFSSPGVARILEVGLSSKALVYMVTEPCSGLSLVHHCDEHNLTILDRLQLVLALCETVTLLHQERVTHGGLTLSSIHIVTTHGKPSPVIVDLGIAHALKDVHRRTEDKEVLADPTLAYCPPERLTSSGHEPTPLNDLYALGAICYEILLGIPPLDIAEEDCISAMEAQQKILREKPRSLRRGLRALSTNAQWVVATRRQTSPKRLRRLLRGRLNRTVLKALRIAPQDRQLSVDVFRRSLLRAHKELSTPTLWQKLLRKVRGR